MQTLTLDSSVVITGKLGWECCFVCFKGKKGRVHFLPERTKSILRNEHPPVCSVCRMLKISKHMKLLEFFCSFFPFPLSILTFSYKPPEKYSTTTDPSLKLINKMSN